MPARSMIIVYHGPNVFSLRIETSLLDKLARKAEREHVSLERMLRLLIEAEAA